MVYYRPGEPNTADYVSYYQNQAGCGLPGYSGSGVMYGAGLGGLFRGLFRMAVPLLKRGFSFAKSHLKSAAKNIVSDVVSNVLTHSHSDKAQDGSGLMVMARKRMSKPPGMRRRGQRAAPKKKKKTVRGSNKRSLVRRKRKRSVSRNVSIKRATKSIF